MLRRSLFVALLVGCAVSTPAGDLHAAWILDGNLINSAAGSQDTPVACSDGAGGAIIAWRDYRSANTDIYAQRVDASGAILWLVDGQPVCTAYDAQSNPQIISDGAGGAIIGWNDLRSGGSLAVYAQRLNASGYPQWTGNGVVVCAAQTGLSSLSLAPDGAGGALIAWYDRRSGTNEVFAQRLNASGAAQWTANGVLLCNGAGVETTPAIASDGSGGAIVSWQDNRSGLNDIYAQRVGSAGALQWAADGVLVCGAGMQQTTASIIPDGSGGAIIGWSDYRNTIDFDIYAQRINASGAVLWTADGVIVSALSTNQQNCRIASIGSGRSILTWLDYRSGTADIYAQRLNADGAPQWTSNGVAACAAVNTQTNMQLIGIDTTGAIAVWQDSRVSISDHQIYAQKMDADGNMLWAADGAAICAATGNQQSAAIAPDGLGGAIIAWQDARVALNVDIYAQRIDAAGHTVVATLLQEWSASAAKEVVEIRWSLSEADPDIALLMLRAEGGSDVWRELPAVSIVRDGLSFSYLDGECEPGRAYRYRVDAESATGRIVLFETGIVRVPASPLALFQNVPNPFNPSTAIRFYVPEPRDVSIEIYDVAGGLVRRLASGHRERGMHTVSWDGRDGRGNAAGSGVYYCRLKSGKELVSRAMVLVR